MAAEGLRADAERNRRLVIDAGIRILGRNPGASIQEVVDESGVGRTTFYRHFTNREELLEAVTREVLVRARRRAAEAAIVPGDPETSIRNLTGSLLDIGFECGPLIASREGGSDAFEAAKAAEGSPTLIFLEEGRRCGDLRTDMSREWLRELVQTVVLTAIELVAAGDIARADAYGYVAGTLTSALLPAR